MNYAALLAVLALLTFTFPVLVRYAQRQGVPQATSILAGLAGAALVLSVVLVQQRVRRDRVVRQKIETIRAQIQNQPNQPSAYFSDGDHLGDLLWHLRRRHEALEVFETYLALEKQNGRDLTQLQTKIRQYRAEMDA